MSEFHNNSADQHTLDWYRDRLGRITGSCVGKIMDRGRRCEFSQTGIAYLHSVIAERLLLPDIIDDDANLSVYLDETTVSSRAMRTGTEREPEARDLYCTLTGSTVIEVGCIPHPTIGGFASSPDGIVTDRDGSIDGVIEIKCPKPATYVEYLTSVHIPEDLLRVNPDYYWQCHSHMAVTGAAWCDFIVYCPYLSRPIHILRLKRDPDALQQLLDRVSVAISHIEAVVSQPTQKSIEDIPQESPKPPAPDDMQKIGQTNLSDSDYDFIIEALAKMLPHYPDSDRLLEKNFRRKVSLLTEKLKTKRSKPQKTK